MFSICCTACDFVTMEEAEIKAHIGTKHTGDHHCRSFSPPSPNLPACMPTWQKRPHHPATLTFLPQKGGLSQGLGATVPRGHPAIAWHSLGLTDLKDPHVQMQLRC